MSKAKQNLEAAMARAMAERPQVGGFPFLAETLRAAGVARNIWNLPSCQSLYLTALGDIVLQNPPLEQGLMEVPKFDESALIRALRRDQNGEGSFPEFLRAAWKAGVIRYEVDFAKRHVTYFGARGESYQEDYPAAG